MIYFIVINYNYYDVFIYIGEMFKKIKYINRKKKN